MGRDGLVFASLRDFAKQMSSKVCQVRSFLKYEVLGDCDAFASWSRGGHRK